MSLTFSPSTKSTRRAKVLLLGEAGTGKTHAALTFPKPAVIDAEGSVDWFADRFDFVSVNTKSYQDARELLEQVRAGRVPCETIVIDSLTTIYNGLLLAASRDREDLRPLDWGRIKRKFSSMLDELYHRTDKHVVCIGWIKSEYAKPGDVVGGQTVKANDLVRVGEGFDGDRKAVYAFDFVFKLDGNDGKRTKATVIKSRSGGLKAGQVIPDFSFKTIEALLPAGDHVADGMSDEEAVERDREVFQDQDGSRRATGQETQKTTIPAGLTDRVLDLGHKVCGLEPSGNRVADIRAVRTWVIHHTEVPREIKADLSKGWFPVGANATLVLLEEMSLKEDAADAGISVPVDRAESESNSGRSEGGATAAPTELQAIQDAIAKSPLFADNPVQNSVVTLIQEKARRNAREGRSA